MTAVREKNIEDYFIRRCRELDVFVIKNTGMNGIPDRLLIWDRMHWFLELKKPGEKPTELQVAVAKKLKAHGAIPLWADSKPCVDRILEALVSRQPAPRDRFIC